MTRKPKTHALFTVCYRREGWTKHQERRYQFEWAAWRFLKKLVHGFSYDPIAEAWLEKRQLGPIEVIWRLNEEDGQ